MPESPNVIRLGPVRGSTVDYILNHLRDGIVHGRYAPGQRLIEADLTAELGVSRGPLREAMRRLSAENMLEIIPNRGAVVRRLSKREMLELFSIRIALEGAAAREATLNLAEKSARTRFEADIQPIWSPAPRVSGADYISENKAFHQAVTRACGNERLMELTQQLQLPLIMFQLLGMLTTETIATSLAEHRMIAQAMLDGDADAAEQSAKQHLVRARSVVEEMPLGVFRA